MKEPKEMELKLRRFLAAKSDEAPIELLSVVASVWVQAATCIRLDYMLEKSGDGPQRTFEQALTSARQNVDVLLRKSAFSISREDCFVALCPIVSGSHLEPLWFICCQSVNI